MFPVDKKASSTKKSLGQQCINSFLAHKLSHDRWLWFFWGRLRVPTRRCDLVVPADGGWGRGNELFWQKKLYGTDCIVPKAHSLQNAKAK